ncbi:MAG: hypothetical protein VX793_06070 [Pseudomonadota bacterium]|nr:hypothetical protein [Pseudomonadota bacterium]
MAVIIGGLIVIWLGLTMAAAGLRWLGVELHYPARLAGPLVLAVLESVLFLLFIPGTTLLPEGWHWPMAGGLTAAAWMINGAVSGLDWYRHRPQTETPATE